jgi:hypothetical protein
VLPRLDGFEGGGSPQHTQFISALADDLQTNR